MGSSRKLTRMWVRIIIYSVIVCLPCEAVTHWFVTEKGMINNQIESVYNLRESYNLVTFLRQENLTKESEKLELELICQKKHIEDTEDKDHDLEKRFLQTDTDCVISEKPIEEFDLYISTVLTLENKGIRAQDFIRVKGKAKKLKKPNCTRISDLPYSIYAYEHLQGMQTRSNVTGQPEKGLFSTLPENDQLNTNLDKIGHYINKALAKNDSSWILYDMATFYWRIKGHAPMAIECARRSLHFSSRKQKDVALLNLANVLHRGHHSADAVILTHAALGISKDVNGLYFTLANVYGALGEFNSSLLFYEQTLQKQPDFEAAKKRIHAIYCQRKLEAALEAQHDSLQRTLSELREYQKLNDHFQSIQEKILAAQSPSDEQYARNMNYHRYKLNNEAHRCQVREEKDNHYVVCRRENSGTPVEMFGNPLVLKETELGAIALGNDNSHCVLTDDGAVLCFNFTTFTSEQDKVQKNTATSDALSSNPASSTETQEEVSATNTDDNTLTHEPQPKSPTPDNSTSLVKSSEPSANPESIATRKNTITNTKESPAIVKTLETADILDKQPEESTTSTNTEASSRSQQDIDEEQAMILAKQKESDRILNDPKRTYAMSDDLIIMRNNRFTVMKRDDTAAEFHARELLKQPGRKETMPKGWQQHEGPYIQDEWTEEECKAYTSSPDWKSHSLRHVHPEKKGIRMVELFNEDLGIEKNEVLSFPYYQPTCVQESKLDQGETVMDYVEGIIQRGSMHNYKGQRLLTKEFLKYGLSKRITMEEMGERVRKAWRSTKSEDNHWMVYNHAGLYWRINGNLHQAIECFRRAVHYVPVEFGDVPLVNVAILMLSIEKYNDAVQLLRMALVVNKTEQLTYFLLGNALAAKGNMTLATEQYRMALKIDGDYQPAIDASRHIYCYTTYFCKDCERIIPRWRMTLGRRKVSNRKNVPLTVKEKGKFCHDNEGIQQCKLQSRSCDYVGDNSAMPSSCYADDPDTNTKGDIKYTSVTTLCPCPDGGNKKQCCAKSAVESSTLSNNIMNSVSHKNSSPHTQHHNSDGKTEKDRVDDLLNTRNYINVNTDGTEGMTVGINVKNEGHTEIVKDKNGVPASVYGPRIPATPVITEDFIKLINKTQLPWPTIQECSSFKKSNLHAYTSTWLSVHAKEISIHDYIDFKTPEGDGTFLRPDCRTDLGASLLTLDHLEGIARRSELQSSSERGLLEVLLNLGDKPMTANEVGTKIAFALKKNRNNWIAANAACLYWRVAGIAKKAVDCSRVALFSSPPEHKDLALINLMNILHRAGYAQDAIVIGGITLESSPQLVVNFFTLANIYSSLNQFTEAIQFYEKTLQQQSDFKPAVDRLKTIKCNIVNHHAGVK